MYRPNDRPAASGQKASKLFGLTGRFHLDIEPIMLARERTGTGTSSCVPVTTMLKTYLVTQLNIKVELSDGLQGNLATVLALPDNFSQIAARRGGGWL